jgi:hypothetical protein
MRKISIAVAAFSIATGVLGATQLAAQEVSEPSWLGAPAGGLTGDGCGKLPPGAAISFFFPGLSIYRPRLDASTPVDSALALQGGGTSILIISTEAPDKQLRGNGTYKAIAIGPQAKTYSWTGTYANIKIDPSLAKGGVTASTRYVTISGAIKRLFGKNCTYEFHGAYNSIFSSF